MKKICVQQQSSYTIVNVISGVLLSRHGIILREITGQTILKRFNSRRFRCFIYFPLLAESSAIDKVLLMY